jgi:hypothetical protein
VLFEHITVYLSSASWFPEVSLLAYHYSTDQSIIVNASDFQGNKSISAF